MKRLRKQLARLDQSVAANAETAAELKNKIIYVKVLLAHQYYPYGEPFISILKDDSLTAQAAELRAKNMESALKNYERHRQSILNSVGSDAEKQKAYDGLLHGDKFFVDEAAAGEAEEEEGRPVQRLEVDKKGNVLKKRQSRGETVEGSGRP